MPENSRPLKLQEIAASQKTYAQAQILKFSSDWSAQVEQLLEQHFAQLIDQIEARVSVEMDEAVVAAGYISRRAASEDLNQLIRRLRQCQSTEEVATWLVDSTASFCGQAALFEVIGTRARAVRARGFPIADAASVEELETDLDQAPAFAHSVRDCDTVIAVGSPAEVSPQVVTTLGHAPTDKVYMCPLIIGGRTVAILYATAGARKAVDGAALELLAHAAAYAAQSLKPEDPVVTRPAVAPDLVSIEGVDLRKRSGAAGSVRQKALEARARWFARAEVARMRVHHGAALKRGREQRDIYGTLKSEIDDARRAYGKDFLAVSPSIADYLHKELLGLVHNDASLLGPEYPGSLV